ncbi:Ureidoglycolate hydrolase [Penicillium maclennaniae]|uniref:Ureidoglycolate hydrolase n=1 Tax=Penicillium maclennaniae TaxID=1343394 RepID=UPI00253F6AC8|nr:Ureidoglycolate hydrolase [Penicillium maclennaniae]KAJ5677505.1 Ureidoglycolate hydrolase [Penicillium maclennaniae]
MAPILTTNPSITIIPELLTPENFAQFGTAICSPVPRDLNIAPNPKNLPPFNPSPVLANQNSALKYSPISPLIDRYAQGPNKIASEARMTMFCCFPRKLRTTASPEKELFDVRILERHPFTNQTFIPIDLSSHSKVGDGEEEPNFLIVVAPTLKGRLRRRRMRPGKRLRFAIRLI